MADEELSMCQCGNKPPHPWEPGEWCPPQRVVPDQVEVDTLRGELREEKEVVAALEESKADCERLLSKKIEEFVNARKQRDEELRERLVEKAQRYRLEEGRLSEDGDSVRARENAIKAHTLELLLDSIFEEADGG